MRNWNSLVLQAAGFLYCLVALAPPADAQSYAVSIDFSGPHNADDINGLDYKLDYNNTYRFTISAQSTDTAAGATLGLLFYSPDGSMVNAFISDPDSLPAWYDPAVWNLGGVQTNTTLLGDGILPDQYLTGGAAFSGAGFIQPTMTPIFEFDVTFGDDEGVFCIDSAFYPPSGVWLFSVPGVGNLTPDWIAGSGDGPVGGTRTGALCLTIHGPPDDPPVFSSCPGSFTRSYCSPVSYSVSASDPEGVDPISYSASHNGAGTVTVNASTGSVEYTPSAVDIGSVVQVTVNASEPDGKNSDCLTNITVTQTAPILTCPANLDAIQGRTTASNPPNVNDPDGCETPVFALVSVTPTPVGSMSISPSTGVVTFVSDAAEPLGAVYTVCMDVTAGGQSASCCFTMTSVPDNPPVFNACPSGLSRSYCSPASYSAAATDPEGVSPISYSGTHDGTGSLSVNASTGVTSYTPTAGDIGNIVEIIVTATESDGPSSQCVTLVTVTKTPPIIICPANVDVPQGNSVASNPPSVNDPDGCETRVFSLVSVTPTPTGTVTIAAGNGRVTFNSDAAEPLNVDYSVCIEVTAGAQSDTCCFIMRSVPDDPPVFSVCPGSVTRSYCSAASYSVTAADPEGASSISYSGSHDGSGSLSVNASTGSVTYTPNSGDIGNVVLVTITATESDGPSTDCETTVSVTQTAPSMVCPPNIAAFAGHSVFSEMPTVSDPDGCESFSYSLVSVSPAPLGSITVAATTGRVTFNSDPNEPSPVDYQVCIEVTAGGQSDTCCMTVTSEAGCCELGGDVNLDGVVTIEDVVYLIAHIFRGGPSPPCDDSADANGDNEVNISDVIYPIAYIFHRGPAPVCGTTGS